MDQHEDENVGIVSMECYFPKIYVAQSDLEKYDNVSSGKYTIGLGQDAMSFTTEREDICSISMTVLSNLLRKNEIDYADVGWICVATETILDHSKSISSMLMQLFEENGNTSIEGIDVKHACYGGTFALLTAFDRITSKYWDRRYCIVISADIAEYEEGPARPSGGCGAVALLLGRNGCIDLTVPRASYKAHEFDFYKPHLDSPYPVVDGPLSNRCYLKALDSCFTAYRAKMGADWRPIVMDPDSQCDEASASPDFWIFHAPYNKLVAKTFGRVVYHDFLSNAAAYFERFHDDEETLQFLKKWHSVPFRETIASREVIKGFERIAAEWYPSMVAPSTTLPKAVGNCYTASIFMGLLSLIVDRGASLRGKEIAMFSYGSGTMASMYSLRVRRSEAAKQCLLQMVEHNDIAQRLADRRRVECEVYSDTLNRKRDRLRRHSARGMQSDFAPQSKVDGDHFYRDTFYLQRVDAQKRRFYAKFESEAEPISVDEDEKGDVEQSESVDIEPKMAMKRPLVMEEEEIKEKIARFKVDEEQSVESKGSSLGTSHFIGDAVLIGAQKVLDKAQDYGLSKKGAIQIDKMLISSNRAARQCSNS